MIKTELLIIDEKEYIRTYSDAGFMVYGGVPEAEYSEAIDPAELGRTYVETDIPIEEEEADAEEIVSILTGGQE